MSSYEKAWGPGQALSFKSRTHNEKEESGLTNGPRQWDRWKWERPTQNTKKSHGRVMNLGTSFLYVRLDRRVPHTLW